MHARSLSRRGFSLRDAVTLAALAGIALALFTPMASLGAGQSRLQVCMGRLKHISKVSAMFAADHQGRIASERAFSGVSHWRSLSDRFYGDNVNEGQAAANDAAVDIIRVRGARTDIDRIPNWVSNASYSHLVLADYAGEELPSENYACPEDANLLAWQSDPRNFNNLGVPSPVPPGALSNADKRWPYISSYFAPTAVWTNDRHSESRAAWYFSDALVFTRLGGHTPKSPDVGHRREDQVAFPAAKAFYADRGARHFTPRAVYWGFPDQKQPILYFDGVVRTTRTGAVDLGWEWNNPDNRFISHSYAVNFGTPGFAWYPGPPDGDQRTYFFSASYWACTRNGLGGRDLP